MDPQMLIDPTTAAGVPAPLWFVELFKVLGFTLHAVPMNLWYAGIVCAMLLHLSGSQHGKRFSSRLMQQMPVIIACGVNLGVVPLLFMQLAYYKVFYPATILIAWHWLSIVVLLIPAYYGVYYYASGLSEDGAGLSRARKAAGWVAAVFFVVIGFLFANGLSLMTNVAAWPELWLARHTGGAPWGMGLNTADPTFWPRWLLMFGLALTTTAVWVLVDQAWFARGESDAYRRWAAGFAPKLYTLGMVWVVAAGSWYMWGTWSKEVLTTMLGGPLIALTILTAMSPGLPWLLMVVGRRRSEANRLLALAVALAQFGVLGLNAISRQVVQNLELKRFFDVFEQETAVQWSPLVLFLLSFVAGLGVVVWMLWQVVGAAPRANVEEVP